MTDSLFRQQAIDQQKDRLYGEVLISQPISITVATSSILVTVVLICLLLIFGTYARREAVSGYLVPDEGLVKIYASLNGVLSKKHIEEGQSVKKGDLLFTVSTLQENINGSDRDALLLSELEQQNKDLNDKKNEEHLLNETKLQSLKTKYSGVILEKIELDESINLIQKQLSLSTKQLSDYRDLFDSGHISKSQIQDLQQNQINIKVSLQSAKRQKIQLINQLTSIQQTIQQNPLEWKSRLSDFNRIESDITQKIVEISGRRLYTIRAPINGRLTALQVTEGQTITPQALLIAVLPENSQLHAELFLPTRAAGFIKINQPVLLRYGAFPYQRYGLYKGKVVQIAEVILSPHELPIPVPLKEPVYRVRVQLNSQHVEAYAKKLPLQAGMLLDADIVLEKRTLWEWLLEPIYGLKGNL